MDEEMLLDLFFGQYSKLDEPLDVCEEDYYGEIEDDD